MAWHGQPSAQRRQQILRVWYGSSSETATQAIHIQVDTKTWQLPPLRFPFRRQKLVPRVHLETLHDAIEKPNARQGEGHFLTNAPPQRAPWKVVRQDLEGALDSSGLQLGHQLLTAVLRHHQHWNGWISHVSGAGGNPQIGQQTFVAQTTCRQLLPAEPGTCRVRRAQQGPRLLLRRGKGQLRQRCEARVLHQNDATRDTWTEPRATTAVQNDGTRDLIPRELAVPIGSLRHQRHRV
mmetsp:Transcript_54343/g.119021  ORF Transcript_54343/g.119021 Transcript_54343/m.119021 type:complete len:237 (+) Transcript_54343:412-1122(+)